MSSNGNSSPMSGLSFDGSNLFVILVIIIVVVFYCTLRFIMPKCFGRHHAHRRRGNLDRVPFSHHMIITINDASRFPSFELPVAGLGLEPSVIAALPTFIYKKPDHIDSNSTGTGTGATTECSICLSTLEEEDLVMLLPNCLHLFHADCIDMWLISQSTCPICRTAANPQEAPPPSPPPPPPVPEQETEAQTHDAIDHEVPPTLVEPLNSAIPSSGGASSDDHTFAQAWKVDASNSRSLRRTLHGNKSERRVQPLHQLADGVLEDLESTGEAMK